MIKKTKQALEKNAREALNFIRQNDNKTVARHILSHDTHPLIQFIKYGMCGVIAVAIQSFGTYALGLTLFPAVGTDIALELKQRNLPINMSIAFFVSASVVYWLNRKFVFKPGRHHPVFEVFLFFVISAIPFMAGHLASWQILRYVKLHPEVDIYEYVEHIATLGFVVASALVNFVARKFIIFKG